MPCLLSIAIAIDIAIRYCHCNMICKPPCGPLTATPNSLGHRAFVPCPPSPLAGFIPADLRLYDTFSQRGAPQGNRQGNIIPLYTHNQYLSICINTFLVNNCCFFSYWRFNTPTDYTKTQKHYTKSPKDYRNL